MKPDPSQPWKGYQLDDSVPYLMNRVTGMMNRQLELELLVRTSREIDFRVEKGPRLLERRVEELVPRGECGEPGRSCGKVG